jgi:hypothetical protein
MQTTQHPEPTSKVEVVLALQSGEKLIINLTALGELFQETDMKTPDEFRIRFQDLMDRYVETIQTDSTLFDLNLFKDDYDFLRKFRELFNKMSWKEVRP